MELRLIDGIGPFFRHYRKKRINWSKVPFAHLETETGIRAAYEETIPADFAQLVRRAAAMGFNGVTVDDVAHLVPSPHYPAGLNRRIGAYRALYRQLFAIADEAGLTPWVTTDVMFYAGSLEAAVGRRVAGFAPWLATACAELLATFPTLGGVVMRVGEADGMDVEGDFRSALVVRTPAALRALLEELLPVFERHERQLVFRTWSLGAYAVGDLMWNRDTFDKAFAGLESPSLVISMKYGESDFFRYLPLNRLFFRSRHRKLVEFQARREYEGFGAYPSFIGWESEVYLRELRQAPNLVGMSVWCQTGGWGKRRQLTFVRNSSVWVELNVFVLSRLARGDRCADAVRAFCESREPPLPPEPFIEFLRLSDEVICKLLYMRELGEKKLFFRRLRLPPQLIVFWDRILVSQTARAVLRCLVEDHQACLEEARAGLAALRRMRRLAGIHGLPQKGLAFQEATFALLAEAREYFFGCDPDGALARIHRRSMFYRKRFRRHYAVDVTAGPPVRWQRALRWGLQLLLRRQRGYRMVDQVFTLRLVSWFYPLLKRWQRRAIPAFAEEQAMGLDVLFK